VYSSPRPPAVSRRTRLVLEIALEFVTGAADHCGLLARRRTAPAVANRRSVPSEYPSRLRVFHGPPSLCGRRPGLPRSVIRVGGGPRRFTSATAAVDLDPPVFVMRRRSVPTSPPNSGSSSARVNERAVGEQMPSRSKPGGMREVHNRRKLELPSRSDVVTLKLGPVRTGKPDVSPRRIRGVCTVPPLGPAVSSGPNAELFA